GRGAIERALPVLSLDPARIEAGHAAGDIHIRCCAVGIGVPTDKAPEPFDRPGIDAEPIDAGPSPARAELCAKEPMPIALRMSDAPTVLRVIRRERMDEGPLIIIRVLCTDTARTVTRDRTG